MHPLIEEAQKQATCQQYLQNHALGIYHYIVHNIELGDMDKYQTAPSDDTFFALEAHDGSQLVTGSKKDILTYLDQHIETEKRLQN